MVRTINLTPTEREHVEWAFGAMADYWGAPCEAGETPDADAEGITENEYVIPEGATMPFLSDNKLTLSTWHEVNDDLLYRIAEMLPDMADNAIGNVDMSRQRATAIALSCERLGDKLRDAMEVLS